MQVDLADDLLTGADAIAAFLGWNKRVTFYACEKQHIPAFKVGKKWCARKSSLKQFFAKLEEGGKAA
jgi:hypothetical protein